MKTCIKCGGSWAGTVAFDPVCAHDFDLAPEPDVDEAPLALLSAPRHPAAVESGFVAYGPAPGARMPKPRLSEWIEVTHPTRAGAIAAWKDAWSKQRAVLRAAESAKALARGTAWEGMVNAFVDATLEERGYQLTVDPVAPDGDRMIVGTVVSDSKPDDEFVTVQIGGACFNPPAVQFTEAERARIAEKVREELAKRREEQAAFPVGSCVRVAGGSTMRGWVGTVMRVAGDMRHVADVDDDADDDDWYAFGVDELELVPEEPKVTTEAEMFAKSIPVGSNVRVAGWVGLGRIEGYAPLRGHGGQYAIRGNDDRPAVWIDADRVTREPTTLPPGAHVLAFDAGCTEGHAWREARVVEFNEKMGCYLVASPAGTKMWATLESVKPAPTWKLED